VVKEVRSAGCEVRAAEPALPAVAGLEPYASGAGWAIYCADVLDLVPRLPAGCVDVVLTDPPFTAAGGSSNGRTSNYDDQFFGHWWLSVWSAFSPALSPAGCGWICCDWRTIGVLRANSRARGERQSSKGWEITQAIVWNRGNLGLGAPYRGGFEMLGFCRGPRFSAADWPKNMRAVMDVPWPYGQHGKGAHPAAKPVNLFSPLLSLPLGKIVCDPFCGSAPVGAAAIAAGRAYIGADIDPHWCEVAANRLHAAEQEPTP
jgi:site-specific DNA-methyltransferase (adenine-specific)